MEKFKLLKNLWEKEKAPLEAELSLIRRQEEDLKAHHEVLVRQKGAQARLCEIKVLELEANGNFSEANTARDEKFRIEASIVNLGQDYEGKLIPLEERRLLLEKELTNLPKKILDGEFFKMQKEAHQVLENGLLGLEEVWSAIQDFEKLTGEKFDN